MRQITDTDIWLVIISITWHRSRDLSTLRYCGTQRSDDIMQQQQFHECTLANMPCIAQIMQNGNNYLRDDHFMPPERTQTDVPLSLVFFSIATNIVAAALTLMHASTPVCKCVRAAASSWKPRVISSSVDGQSVARHPVGWRQLALL